MAAADEVVGPEEAAGAVGVSTTIETKENSFHFASPFFVLFFKLTCARFVCKKKKRKLKWMSPPKHTTHNKITRLKDQKKKKK